MTKQKYKNNKNKTTDKQAEFRILYNHTLATLDHIGDRVAEAATSGTDVSLEEPYDSIWHLFLYESHSAGLSTSNKISTLMAATNIAREQLSEPEDVITEKIYDVGEQCVTFFCQRVADSVSVLVTAAKRTKFTLQALETPGFVTLIQDKINERFVNSAADADIYLVTITKDDISTLSRLCTGTADASQPFERFFDAAL